MKKLQTQTQNKKTHLKIYKEIFLYSYYILMSTKFNVSLNMLKDEERKNFAKFVETMESAPDDVFKPMWDKHMSIYLEQENLEEDNTFICISKHAQDGKGIKYFPELDDTALHIANKYDIKMIKINGTPSDSIKRHYGYYCMVMKSLKQTQFFLNKMKQLAFKYYNLRNPRPKIDWSKV